MTRAASTKLAVQRSLNVVFPRDLALALNLLKQANATVSSKIPRPQGRIDRVPGRSLRWGTPPRFVTQGRRVPVRRGEGKASADRRGVRGPGRPKGRASYDGSFASKGSRVGACSPDRVRSRLDRGCGHRGRLPQPPPRAERAAKDVDD